MTEPEPGMTEIDPAGGAGGVLVEPRRSRPPRPGTVAAVPVVFGYVRVPPGVCGGAAVVIGGVETFARSRGWMLDEAFVDDDPARPFLAWGSLVAVARGEPPNAVVVASAPGSAVVGALRSRLAREVGIRLVVVDLPVPSGGGEWFW